MSLTKMYNRGVEFIALNDEPTKDDVCELADQLSVVTLAETFLKSSLEVARDVLAFRKAHMDQE